MKESQYATKKAHLANKIKAYYAKLNRKQAVANSIFKAKEQARIGREHGKWDRKATRFEARLAKFQARAAKWKKEWGIRKMEWEHRKDC